MESSMAENRKKILNLLVAGPLPPPLGGTTVLFERLVRYLGKREDVSVEVIDTGRVRGRGLAGVGRFFRLIIDVVRQARAAGLTNVAWYANSRPMPELPMGRSDGSGCRRFVFLGQVHRGKGVRELVEAGERLPEGVTVDIYGPLDFDIQESEFNGRDRVTYRGPVDPDDVHGVLSKYGVLVLPSYHHGEGYPGVILEAYAAGLPVVSTRWRAIPELVDDGVTGLLVEPRDAGALCGAMLSLVDGAELYARLREGVRRTREQFSDEVWHERFLEYCRSLTRC
jgi:glycosyltransferase involved in cell wall biosynthesis